MSKSKARSAGDHSIVEQRLGERPELREKYGDAALPLLGLALYTQADDIDALAAESLTDGGNDKKIDFCYIDRSRNYAAVVQGFCSNTWGKPSAEANKATDLIGAAGWLFTGDLAEVPEKLRSVATELREAVHSKEINRIEFLYIHNCHESDNVKSELATAAKTASRLLNDETVSVAGHELGLEALDELCLAAESQIFVEDTVKISAKNVIDERGGVWQSIVTSMSGDWLHSLHKRHGSRLFLANYRDFLGIRNSIKNINKGIKTSVQSDANNFWTYNNGITALVRNISKKGGRFTIEGISIINGAQTTGSIAGCSASEAANVKVVCRFVVCSDEDVLHKIIKYNNTQNAFRSSDQRSNDIVQNRLFAELQKHGIAYVSRRSGVVKAAGSITADGVAPLLCAFHGDPQTAARSRNDIFDVDSIYARVFPSSCAGEHVVLVNCLGMAIDEVKIGLKIKDSAKKTTASEKKNYDVLRTSTAKLFLMSVIGAIADEIVGERMPDSFTWRFTQQSMKKSLEKRVFPWKEVVEAVLPQVAGVIGNDAYVATREFGRVPALAAQVAAIINGAGPALTNRFGPIRDATEW